MDTLRIEAITKYINFFLGNSTRRELRRREKVTEIHPEIDIALVRSEFIEQQIHRLETLGYFSKEFNSYKKDLLLRQLQDLRDQRRTLNGQATEVVKSILDTEIANTRIQLWPSELKN